MRELRLEVKMSEVKVADYDYHGMIMSKPFFPPEVLDKLKESTFDDGDILIATYAKCGE